MCPWMYAFVWVYNYMCVYSHMHTLAHSAHILLQRLEEKKLHLADGHLQSCRECVEFGLNKQPESPKQAKKPPNK